MIVFDLVDPNFIMMAGMRFVTPAGSIIMSEGEPISIRKRRNALVLGDNGPHALVITNEALQRTFLLNCSPFTANFTEGAEEDFEVTITEDCDLAYKTTKMKEDRVFQQELYVSDVLILAAPLETS